jgi:hypothetical protein
MNEKIDALVKKATIRVNNPILNSDGKIVVDDWEEGVSISMLAELIIKECADICYNRETEQSDLCAAEILEHFGVKE